MKTALKTAVTNVLAVPRHSLDIHVSVATGSRLGTVEALAVHPLKERNINTPGNECGYWGFTVQELSEGGPPLSDPCSGESDEIQL